MKKEYCMVIALIIFINLIAAPLRTGLHAEQNLIFELERRIGFIPTLLRVSDVLWEARNPFSADSGTGMTHSAILRIKLLSDSLHIDSLKISSDSHFLKFKSVRDSNKQYPFTNFIDSGIVYNVSNDSLIDLEVLFKPDNDMVPGYYSANLLFEAKEINDSGYIYLKFPCRLLYNPDEWYDSTKKPGIELFMISDTRDTTNLIFGSSYKSTYRDDTLFGESGFEYYFHENDARFVVDEYPWIPQGLNDISPNDENAYSRSRDIRSFINDSTPLIFHLVFNFPKSNYPIKLEFETYNFNPTGTFIIEESLDTTSKFRINLRETILLSNGRHQFSINDTSISDFYIYYYKQLPNNVADKFIQALTIFPNPVQDEIYLTMMPEKETIEIISITGVMVLKTEYCEILNVAHISAGIYFLKVGNEVYKFIKL